MMKYRVNDYIQSLNYFSPLIDLSNEIIILDKLDIEPFQKFSLEFSSIYWYFQYVLLKDGKIEICKEDINNEYKGFFSELELNIVSISIIDAMNYEIKSIDGVFNVSVFNNALIPTIEKFSENWCRE